jgi:hypothetical protein
VLSDEVGAGDCGQSDSSSSTRTLSGSVVKTSDIGYRVHTEVRDIGGGRGDVAAFYERFTLVCELKREDTDVSANGQRRHLLQAA